MTEAVKAIVDYAFRELKLHKLSLCLQHDNTGSQRVAEKAGFKFEARLKDERFRNGEYKDLVWYCLFRDEYFNKN
jgi:RimJ/RimL family protein N-acetyltransferase